MSFHDKILRKETEKKFQFIENLTFAFDIKMHFPTINQCRPQCTNKHC